MIRDRIVAIHEYTMATVSDPVALGALRSTDSGASWTAEAEHALRDDRRVVLSGDISNLPEIADRIREFEANHSTAQFALLIHWSQARSTVPEFSDLRCFESVYVAIDEDLSPSTLRAICDRWPVKWVLMPRVGVSWTTWIPNILNSKPRGFLTVLTPSSSDSISDSGYLSPDELALHIAQLSIDHPLVKIQPAPHEWFIPSELSPWGLKQRDFSTSKIVHDSRTRDDVEISFVVPFFWTGSVSELIHLRSCLESIEKLRSTPRPWELIVSVDRAAGAPELTVEEISSELTTQTMGLAIVDNPREHKMQESPSTDWRAGFIRNSGARVAQTKNGHFVFIDSDVRIGHTEGVQQILKNLNSDVLQIGPDAHIEKPMFQTASSSFLVVRKKLFHKLGGFADAFSAYGCEDNFFVWSARNVDATATTIPASYFEHLRDSTRFDTRSGKMIRLQKSANLLYRMTLDPKTHAHFYSALGENVWPRAVLKRLFEFQLARFMLGPLVFLFTLAQSTSRKQYLMGFYDIVSWSLRYHVNRRYSWRNFSWQLPYAIAMIGVYRGRIIGQILRLWGHLKGMTVRFAWFLKSIVGALLKHRGTFERFVWKLRSLNGTLRRHFGTLKKYWVIWIVVPAIYILNRPKHWIRQYGWVFPVAATRLKDKFTRRRGSHDV